MTELERLQSRLKDLNTKAYYLLVALSFIYGKANKGACSLKIALSLTALAAVLPLQDTVKSEVGLEIVRWFKVSALTVALGFTIYWVGWIGGTSK
jgi:Flp pilus assembly protein protease CpaA